MTTKRLEVLYELRNEYRERLKNTTQSNDRAIIYGSLKKVYIELTKAIDQCYKTKQSIKKAGFENITRYYWDYPLVSGQSQQ